MTATWNNTPPDNFQNTRADHSDIEENSHLNGVRDELSARKREKKLLPVTMGRCLSLCLLLLLLLAILPFPVVRAKKMRGCLKLGFRACGAPMGKRTANQDSGPPNDYMQLWNAFQDRENKATCVLDRTVSLLPMHIQSRIYEIFSEMILKQAELDEM